MVRVLMVLVVLGGIYLSRTGHPVIGLAVTLLGCLVGVLPAVVGLWRAFNGPADRD